MNDTPPVEEIAVALRTSVGLLRRRLRALPLAGELSFPESAALARLDRGGPTTSAELARLEQISPQSMGATLAALESRGLIQRAADPTDGRRVIMSLTEGGAAALRDLRDTRGQQLAAALSSGFSAAELRQLAAAAPLIQRLAERL